MATVTIVNNSDVVSIDTPVREVVEVQTGGVQGPQGPTGAAGGGIIADVLANRAVSANEGDLFASTDTNEFFIWFV